MAALEALFGARYLTEQRKVESYLAPFQIYWPTEADSLLARTFAKFRLSEGIELIDSFTAAIALRHNLPLATFNIKHFLVIPDLAIVQPYVR